MLRGVCVELGGTAGTNIRRYFLSGTQRRGRDPPERGHGVSSRHSQAPARGTGQNGRKGTYKGETREAHSRAKREGVPEYTIPGLRGSNCEWAEGREGGVCCNHTSFF